MTDTDREMLELATDLVLGHWPVRNAPPERLAAEIRRVLALLMNPESEGTPEPEAAGEDAFDPETGLLKEARVAPFLRDWAAEAEALTVESSMKGRAEADPPEGGA